MSSPPDIYGQVHPEETSELISSKLALFETELAKIPDKDKECLAEAETKCPDLLTKDFKLQFLRCEVFNADLAAKRYAKYWEKRVSIFGPERAFQPLTLDGALKDDQEALKLGFVQLPGTQDPSGRSIVMVDPAKQENTEITTEAKVRAAWYVFHAALENISTQQKGVVILVYPKHLKKFNRPLAKEMTSSIKGCLPVRMSGFHVCYPPTIFRIIFPILKLFMGERLRKRIRAHPGSEDQVIEALSKYGMTKEMLPSDLGGDVVIDHHQWLKDRAAQKK